MQNQETVESDWHFAQGASVQFEDSKSVRDEEAFNDPCEPQKGEEKTRSKARKRPRKRKKRKQRKTTTRMKPKGDQQPDYLAEDYRNLQPLQDIVVVSRGKLERKPQLRSKANRSPHSRQSSKTPILVDINGRRSKHGRPYTVLDYLVELERTTPLNATRPPTKRPKGFQSEVIRSRTLKAVEPARPTSRRTQEAPLRSGTLEQFASTNNILDTARSSFKWNTAIERIKVRMQELGLDFGPMETRVLDWHLKQLIEKKRNQTQNRFVRENQGRIRDSIERKQQQHFDWVRRRHDAHVAAKERKAALEEMKQQRIRSLVERKIIKKQVQEHRTRMERIKEKWIFAILLARSTGIWLENYKGVRGLQKKRRFATIIQRNVRRHQAMVMKQRYLWSRDVISRCAYRWALRRRKQRPMIAANILLTFLENNRWNFGIIVSSFRTRVTKCQRSVRDYLECTKARLLALSRRWTKQERVLAFEHKQFQIQELQREVVVIARDRDESKRKMSRTPGDDPSVGTPTLALLSQMEESTRSQEKYRFARVSRLASMTGKHTNIRRQSSHQDHVIAFALDDVLLHEVCKRLEKVRDSPPTLCPVSKETRTEFLKDVIRKAREAFKRQLEIEKEKRRARTLGENAITLQDARALVSMWQMNVMEDGGDNLDHLIPDITQVSKFQTDLVSKGVSVMLYSRLSDAELLTIVRKAHEAERKIR